MEAKRQGQKFVIDLKNHCQIRVSQHSNTLKSESEEYKNNNSSRGYPNIKEIGMTQISHLTIVTLVIVLIKITS